MIYFIILEFGAPIVVWKLPWDIIICDGVFPIFVAVLNGKLIRIIMYISLPFQVFWMQIEERGRYILNIFMVYKKIDKLSMLYIMISMYRECSEN